MVKESPLAFAPSVLYGVAEPCAHCGRSSACGSCTAADACTLEEPAAAAEGAEAAPAVSDVDPEGAVPFCCYSCRTVYGAVHKAEMPLLEPLFLLLCSLDEAVLSLSRLLLVMRLLLLPRLPQLLPCFQAQDAVSAAARAAAANTVRTIAELSDHLNEALQQPASAPYLAQARLASAGLAALLLPLLPGGSSLEALEREALRLCMVVRVNGFEISAGSGGCAIFPHTALLNHDCAPNCCARWERTEGRLTVRALRRVAAGEELTISYLGVRSGRDNGEGFNKEAEAGVRRRALLRSTKYFECSCALCCSGL